MMRKFIMIFMTIIMKLKKCPICKRKYPWNPDIGKTWCPHCGPLSMVEPEKKSINNLKDITEKNKV